MEEKQITIPANLEGYHYKAFADQIMTQLKNPKSSEVDLALAAKNAGLPENIDPQTLAESDGFNFVLDNIGLTDEFLAQALYDDIQAKPANRIQELKLAAQMRGVAEKKKVDPNVTANQTVNKAMDLMETILTQAKDDSNNNIIDV